MRARATAAAVSTATQPAIRAVTGADPRGLLICMYIVQPKPVQWHSHLQVAEVEVRALRQQLLRAGRAPEAVAARHACPAVQRCTAGTAAQDAVRVQQRGQGRAVQAVRGETREQAPANLPAPRARTARSCSQSGQGFRRPEQARWAAAAVGRTTGWPGAHRCGARCCCGGRGASWQCRGPSAAPAQREEIHARRPGGRRRRWRRCCCGGGAPGKGSVMGWGGGGWWWWGGGGGGWGWVGVAGWRAGGGGGGGGAGRGGGAEGVQHQQPPRRTRSSPRRRRGSC